MAVVVPYARQAWTDGVSSCSAARNNVHEDGINDAHYMPTVRAGRAAVLSVVTATWTLVPWTNEPWDTAGNAASTMHDNSTTPARLIARHAGKFAWSLTLMWDANTTGIRAVNVQKNSEALPATANTGVYQGGSAITTPTTSISLLQPCSGIADLAVNDYLACVVYQNSGGNLNLNTDSHFEMVRVG